MWPCEYTAVSRRGRRPARGAWSCTCAASERAAGVDEHEPVVGRERGTLANDGTKATPSATSSASAFIAGTDGDRAISASPRQSRSANVRMSAHPSVSALGLSHRMSQHIFASSTARRTSLPVWRQSHGGLARRSPDNDLVDGRVARANRTRIAVVDALLQLIDEGDLRPTAARIAEQAAVAALGLPALQRSRSTVRGGRGTWCRLERLSPLVGPLPVGAPLTSAWTRL